MEKTGTLLGSRDSAEPGMLLGADFLRTHHVLIADSMGVMVFRYMGGPVFDISQRQARASSQTGADPAQQPAH